MSARPRIDKATAIKGGRIEVEWLYDPRYEDPAGTGAAAEARIYWDAGTGTMDWTEPHATVALGGPEDAARYTWESAALTDGQEYRFAVRIGTAAWPDGVETENEDTHAATADTSTPSAPELSAAVI